MKQVKRALIAGLAVLALLIVLSALWVAATLSHLPDISLLKRYRPAVASEVLDRNGAILAHFYEKKFRIWAPIAGVPDTIIQAVVTAEDDTFFGHRGVNYRAVWEALQHDVRKKRFARGGSTITQQMIKNVLLSKEKTISRKLREFVLARQAEELLTKRQILEIYLNEVEWGENVYGIEAASRYYFDKHVPELTAAEAALLAGMLPNPRYYDPFKRPDKARQRQEQVLFNMFQAKLLTEEQYQSSLAAPVRLRDGSSRRFDFSMLSGGNGRPCAGRILEQALLSFYDDRDLYRGGLRIRTTLDKDLQDRFSAFMDAPGESTHDVPAAATVLKEGGEIHAIACSQNEEQARFFLGSLGVPNPVYEASSIAVSGIAKEAILQPDAPAPTEQPVP